MSFEYKHIKNTHEISFKEFQKEIFSDLNGSKKFLSDIVLTNDSYTEDLNKNVTDSSSQSIYQSFCTNSESRRKNIKRKVKKPKDRNNYIPTKRYRRSVEGEDSLADIVTDNNNFISNEDKDILVACCSANNIPALLQEIKIETLPKVTLDTSDCQKKKVTYDCHMCDKYSTDHYLEFYNHLVNHKVFLDNKVKINDLYCQQKRECCPICGNIVVLSDLKNHLVMHIDSVRCSICNEFVQIIDLTNHMAVHSRHMVCDICGDLFKSKMVLTKHFRSHRNNPEFKCDHCHYKFTTMTKLIAHISSKHQSIDPIYGQCPYCWQLTTNLKYHISSPMACKYKCKVCLTRITPRESFAIHMRGHYIKEEMK